MKVKKEKIKLEKCKFSVNKIDLMSESSQLINIFMNFMVKIKVLVLIVDLLKQLVTVVR